VITMHRTYTASTHWVDTSRARELRCKVREYVIWYCTECKTYFWQKPKGHKH